VNNLCAQCLCVKYLEDIYIYIERERERERETKVHQYRCLKQDILYVQISEANSLSKDVPGEMVFYYIGTN
jgi:hypothetical protein